MAINKILVLDDSPTMQRILVNTLNKAGFTTVDTANDGDDGLKKLASGGSYDLILTDWNMPVMTGIDFLKAVKADPATKHIPVIMVTSRNVKEDILLAIKSGARDYIVKPFTPEAIKEKIGTLSGSNG
ncbi:MAG: response regulator [Fibrobacteres bacterium]|nr:response regulator [Fibrobacterota bacterium]